VFKRHGHARVITKTASLTQLIKWKDFFHFYLFLGALVFGGTAFTVNTLYGPCQLVDTPEDYEPRFWQYNRHPMHQLINRYTGGHQACAHEVRLGMYEHLMKQRVWDREEMRARRLMYERQDYKAWYYVPYTSKWIEWSHWEFENWKRTLPAFMTQHS